MTSEMTTGQAWDYLGESEENEVEQVKDVTRPWFFRRRCSRLELTEEPKNIWSEADMNTTFFGGNARFKPVIKTPEAEEAPETLTVAQATDFMMENPGREVERVGPLVGLDCYRIQKTDSGLRYFQVRDSGSEEWRYTKGDDLFYDEGFSTGYSLRIKKEERKGLPAEVEEFINMTLERESLVGNARARGSRTDFARELLSIIGYEY